MGQLYIGGAGNVNIWTGSTFMARCKTASATSINVEAANEEVRGGQGNKLWGRYFHDSVLNVEITDVMFNLEFIAANVGSIVSQGGIIPKSEEVECTTTGELTVSELPADFLCNGEVGWYKHITEDDDQYKTMTFRQSGGVATQVADADAAVAGERYCVMYRTESLAARTVVIPANIIPGEVSIEIDAPLFRGDKAIGEANAQSAIGTVFISIPRLQLNGTVDLTMESGGTSTTSLSGIALASTGCGTSCEADEEYGTISVFEKDADWTSNLVGLYASPASLVFDATTTSASITVMGAFNSGSPNVIPPENLEYTLVESTSGWFTLTGNTVAVGTATAGDTGQVIVKVKDATGSIANLEAIVNLTVE